MLTRLSTAVVVLTVSSGSLLLHAAPAYAGCAPNTICVNPGASGSTPGGGGSTGGGPAGGGPSGSSGPPPPCPVILTTCLQGPAAVPAAPVLIPPSEYAAHAFDQKLLPPPVPSTTPGPTTYVRLSTYFWIGPGVWQRFTATAGIPGQEEVTAIAEPDNLTWKTGDGSPDLVCHSAGSSTDPSCAHTYTRSSAGQPGSKYTIEATMTWTVSWVCVGPLCQGQNAGNLVGNPIIRPSGPRQLDVREIQTESTPH
ncbi:MAG: hypothetical protein QOE54_3474 [Streptosporangiaceae bacterium]|nr:hypothetical protein [Streptosporangiaceae bacterium]